MSIIVTRNAWNKMRNILSKTKNQEGFLFSAKGGGCNGFNFDLSLFNDKNIFDVEPEILCDNEVKLYVDPISEMYLLGTTIDYISEDYSKGQYESKFVFNVDKKFASSCGCGVSFSPKNLD